MEKLKNKWLLVSLLFITGCGLYDTIEVNPNPQPNITIVVDNSLSSKIKETPQEKIVLNYTNSVRGFLHI
jgi:hypothetical protein